MRKSISLVIQHSVSTYKHTLTNITNILVYSWIGAIGGPIPAASRAARSFAICSQIRERMERLDIAEISVYSVPSSSSSSCKLSVKRSEFNTADSSASSSDSVIMKAPLDCPLLLLRLCLRFFPIIVVGTPLGFSRGSGMGRSRRGVMGDLLGTSLSNCRVSNSWCCPPTKVNGLSSADDCLGACCEYLPP